MAGGLDIFKFVTPFFCPGDLRARAGVSSDKAGRSLRCRGQMWSLCWGRGGLHEFISGGTYRCKVTRKMRALPVMVKQDVWRAVTSSLCWGGHCGWWEECVSTQEEFSPRGGLVRRGAKPPAVCCFFLASAHFGPFFSFSFFLPWVVGAH